MRRLAWLHFIIRTAIGVTFLTAGCLKAENIASFADSIASFRVLPSSLINLTAMSLSPCEIIVGSLLLFGHRVRNAAFAAFMLISLFVLAFAQGLVRGLNIDCGCFGPEQPAVWKTWASLVRDIILLLMTLWLYLQSVKWASIQNTLLFDSTR